jgi:hypothetical protein
VLTAEIVGRAVVGDIPVVAHGTVGYLAVLPGGLPLLDESENVRIILLLRLLSRNG